MPTYEYACAACGHEFEEFQSIVAQPLTKCPSCGQRALQRLIGRGGGIIFKGSGFYQTDYRSESYQKAAAAESKGAAGDGQKAEGAPAACPWSEKCVADAERRKRCETLRSSP